MDSQWRQKYALPEDVCMFGFEPLMSVYNNMQLQWIRPPREGRCIEVLWEYTVEYNKRLMKLSITSN